MSSDTFNNTQLLFLDQISNRKCQERLTRVALGIPNPLPYPAQLSCSLNLVREGLSPAVPIIAAAAVDKTCVDPKPLTSLIKEEI